MLIEILGTFDRNKLYCAGSVTKFLTTFVVLSLLAEKYNLAQILDDENFLDKIAGNEQAKCFLKLFQKIIGSQFTIRDLCTYHAGLPYTFDVTEDALERTDAGELFKHHSLLDEKTFLYLCEHHVKTLYPNRSKFHYSELSIIFFAYLIEKIYGTTMEELYQKYLLIKFNLQHSFLSRVRPAGVFIQELSDKFDYAAVAVQDHGFFCYSNAFYTTLNDMALLFDGIVQDKIFQQMTDIAHARAAGLDLMNGLAVEIKTVDDDVLYTYEGLSFSGCNIWGFSVKAHKGYVTFCNDENEAYGLIYGKFGYTTFDPVPPHALVHYSRFATNYDAMPASKLIPVEYQGRYQRVKINDIVLDAVSVLGPDYLETRDPEDVKYDLMYVNDDYHIRGKDQIHESRIKLHQARSGNRYMFFNGSLYKQISEGEQSLADVFETLQPSIKAAVSQ